MKKRNTAFAVLMLICMTLSICGCELELKNSEETATSDTTQTPELTPFPVVINDIEIKKSPETIISLSPSLTEIIYEFGEGGRLVGRGKYCDYPSGVEKLPEVGSSANPNINKIIEIKPDIVLASSTIATKDLLLMEQNGITTLIFTSPTSLEEYKRLYTSVGLLFNGMFTGTEEGESRFSAISKACDNSGAVYIGNYIYVTEDLQIAGKDTLEDAIFTCFGNNIAVGSGYQSVENLTKEPDVILVNHKYTLEGLSENEEFANFAAVKDKKVIFIDNSYFERPTSRIVDMINGFIADFKKL